jgi:hypothetical protein
MMIVLTAFLSMGISYSLDLLIVTSNSLYFLHIAESLEDLEILSVLSAHEHPISRLEMLEETGHLVSQTCEGEILFWDYPKAKSVKVEM